METVLMLDAANYDPALPELRRVAVRGIIFREGRLLLVRSSFGEVKLPGGGQEPGEDDTATLVREVLEETGYRVLPDSIRPFGQVVERRLSVHEPMIWHQISRCYVCRVQGEQQACSLSENEKRHQLQPLWLPLEQAVETNRRLRCTEGEKPWNEREYRLLQLLLQRGPGPDTDGGEHQ